MKKLTHISRLLLCVFLITSCNSWLELEPPEGLIREEFWQTKEDVESAVMGAYHAFADLDGMLFKYGEIRGDMVIAGNNVGSDDRLIMEGTIYPDNSLCDWKEFYKIINYCNEVLNFAPGVKDKDKTFTDYQLYGFLSEAYFLRSLAYFYLVRIFKEVPLVLTPTISDASPLYPFKSSESEILTQIKDDLNKAYPWATVDGYLTIADNKGRATKASIDALLADIALWEFDYETVISRCDNIINSRKYELIRGPEWFEIFYPGNSQESIFEFQLDNYSQNQYNDTYGLTNYYSYNYIPSDYSIEIFDIGTTSERDIFRGFGLSIKEQFEDEFIIWKYVGMIGDNQTARMESQSNSANWIVYRLADIYLMKAEALSQLQRYDEALANLMVVREERSMNYPKGLINTPSSFEDKILEERARELAFEGKRWFDLLRMGRRNNYARKGQLISLMVRNVPSTQKRILQTKLTNPLSWYLPIFETELERNQNLVQNPYYNF